MIRTALTPLVLAIPLALALGGCHRSKHAHAGGADGPSASGPPLQENLHEQAKGPEGTFGILGYRGGPRESMVITSCDQCSGPWSPELLKENDGSHRFRPDDPPVADPVAPAADVGTVPLAAPTWCARYHGSLKSREQPLEYWPLDHLKDPFAMEVALDQITWMACDRERYAPRQRHVKNLLQAWLNLTHIRFESIVPVLEVVASTGRGARREPPPPSGDAAVDALAGGCFPIHSSHDPGDWKPLLDTLDVLEGAGKLTELDRAAATCHVAARALSAIDLRKLDLDKAQAELSRRFEAKRISVESYRAALLGILDLRLWTPAHLDATSDDPEIKRFHGPAARAGEAAYASWKTTVGAPNQEVLTAAFGALLRARGPVAEAKGCSAVTRPLFEKLVKAKGTAQREELDRILTDPVGSVVFQADASCNAIDAPLLGAAEVDAVNREPSWLGPRRAAVMDAMGIRLGALDAKTLAGLSELRRVKLVPVNAGYPKTAGRATYEVKSVTPQGDELLVMPQGRRWIDPTYGCHSTGEITRIRPDGYLEYGEECQQTGSEAMKLDHAPLLVPKEFSGLLARGAVVIMMLEDTPEKHAVVASAGTASSKQAPVHAHPVIIYANDKPKTPVSYYYGVKLP